MKYADFALMIINIYICLIMNNLLALDDKLILEFSKQSLQNTFLIN